MQALSIILPFRASDPCRIRNLERVLEHYVETYPDAEYLLVEQKLEPARIGEFVSERVIRLHLPDDGPFNKSRCINVGVLGSTHEKLLIADTDMLLTREAIDRAAHALDAGIDLVRPWQRLIDLDEQASDLFFATGELPDSPSASRGFDRQYAGESLCVAGGAFLVRKQFFLDIGGFDPRFEGWGGEDDAFAFKAESLSSRTVISRDTIAWHLWHPRQRIRQDASYQSNVARLLETKRMDREQLRELGNQQRNALLNDQPQTASGAA